MEQLLLKQWMDVSVQASGNKNTMLTIDYVLMGRPLVFNFINDATITEAITKQGFKAVVLTDGYDSTWRFAISKAGWKSMQNLPTQVNQIKVLTEDEADAVTVCKEPVEIVRARYRPDRILTLFVGESAPAGGAFFYFENDPSHMTRCMRKAVESVFGPSSNFLATFKSYGWYLDDLVLTPVNHLNSPERTAACKSARASLVRRIEEYQPQAIVSLLLGIRGFVDEATISAGSNATRYAVPFPGMGQQARFLAAMADLIPKLPRSN